MTAMHFFSALSIRYKILSIAAVAIIGFGIYFALNFSVASSNARLLEQMRDMTFPALERSELNLTRLDQITSQLDQAVATEEEEMIEDADQTLAAMQAAFDEIAALDPQQAETVQNLQQALTAYFSLARELTLGMLNDSIEASQLQNHARNMQAQLNTFRDDLKRFRDQRREAFTQAIASADNAAQFSLGMGAMIGAILLIVLAANGYWVAAGITRNIKQVSDNLQEIASGEGDLTRRLKAGSQDEIGQLAEHFNTFMDKLQGIIQELIGYSGKIGTSAQEVASIARQSHDGMEHQRAETDQVATASNEMAATVSEVAHSAEQAAEAAGSASTAASHGNTVVDETIAIINHLADDVEQGAHAVNRLREDSESVGSVLDVIRGIAEQTNLLALNAAIEAARAGEQGRGFAVVADEVRTLASRTQESTQEIQAMIESLQDSAGQAAEIMGRGKISSEQGVAKAANAGEALGKISQAVAVISEMNAQIASAAEEQSTVALEMDQNITNIRHATEENTENSNQLATAGAALNQVATQMQQLVRQFKV
ncbi:MAG TPA: methyl-accepting chemotaxis protein [Gammaproteobacteria bacterium]|nr:methyl-accepting chemotaxis protein [Gammaproteobacteria bacterium]